MTSYQQEQGHRVTGTGGFLAGLLMGGLAGAGAMLLLAPSSGKRTRDKIQEEGLELRGQVVDTVDGAVAQARGGAHRMARRVRKQTKVLQKRGGEMIDEHAEVASHLVEEGKKVVHDVANG